MSCRPAKNLYKRRHIADKYLVKKPRIDEPIFEFYRLQNSPRFLVCHGRLIAEYKTHFSCHQQRITFRHIQWSIDSLTCLEDLSVGRYRLASN